MLTRAQPASRNFATSSPRVLRGAAQPARALVAPRAPVVAEDLFPASDALGVGPHGEARVDGAPNRPRVALLGLAPLVQHPALVNPLVRAEVGRVPAVRVFGRRAQRALLAPSADPDGHARLQGLGDVRRALEPEVFALEVRAAPSGSKSRRRHCAYSSSMSSRTPVRGNSKPNAVASTSCQPAPMPQSTRPPERWSIVVSDFAWSPGCGRRRSTRAPRGGRAASPPRPPSAWDRLVGVGELPQRPNVIAMWKSSW